MNIYLNSHTEKCVSIFVLACFFQKANIQFNWANCNLKVTLAVPDHYPIARISAQTDKKPSCPQIMNIPCFNMVTCWRAIAVPRSLDCNLKIICTVQHHKLTTHQDLACHLWCYPETRLMNFNYWRTIKSCQEWLTVTPKQYPLLHVSHTINQHST